MIGADVVELVDDGDVEEVGYVVEVEEVDEVEDVVLVGVYVIASSFGGRLPLLLANLVVYGEVVLLLVLLLV